MYIFAVLGITDTPFLCIIETIRNSIFQILFPSPNPIDPFGLDVTFACLCVNSKDPNRILATTTGIAIHQNTGGNLHDNVGG